MSIINTELLRPANFITIGLIAVLWIFAFEHLLKKNGHDDDASGI